MKRRTFIQSAALLPLTMQLPVHASTADLCINQPSNKDKGKAVSIALVSDLHIGDDNLLSSFSTALNNIKENHKISNIIIPGDISDSLDYISKVMEYVENTFQGENEKVIAILGNHDVRGPDSKSWTKDPDEDNPYYKFIIEKYKNMNAKKIKHEEKHACFDIFIGDHHFIALNTDRGLKDLAYYDNSTLEWFEKKLSENVKGRKFVISHQPLNDTHWRSNLFGGFGEQDDEIKKILSKHPKTFFISGHIHNGFGVLEAMQRDFGTLIETPSFNRTENGLIEKGYGFIIKIESDAVNFEAWNFLENIHYPEYDLKITDNAVSSILEKKKEKEECYDKLISEIYPWEKIAEKNDGGDSIIAGQEHFGLRKLWPNYKWERYSSAPTQGQ
ncbi:metallophosphoesterase family protein [Pectobacterium zantedeschiae]|uniref:Metallophosphoesterase n=1 Tax=Pectobacterium zantedeschiae TaxID=2034769 RepID=A0A9X8JFN7_9GAMM|nr:metallophosphoesterase [Pectobacterium zantedeschiae]RYC40090.1 metallophosphoesterase [Pectobacterium zantedeschiae]RYC40822.1 metallophosphoesterase [Pectobacterium zantedeschiae]